MPRKSQNAKMARPKSKVLTSTDANGPLSRFFKMAKNPNLSTFFPSGASARGRKSRVEVEDEYIADIAGSTTFATTQFPLNPGQASTFPWLSQEAKLFEKYKILGLEFYYRPQVSAYATNGQTGKVMLSFDYDASDPAPATKQQVEDTHPHADGMPYETVLLPVDSKESRRQDSYFVRPGGLPGGSDIKTYDFGTLSVSTIGNNSTANIGELRVRYAIALIDPVLENTVNAPLNLRVSQFQSAGGSESAGATTVAKTLAIATVTTNGLQAVNSSGVITLPVGNYIVNAGVIVSNTNTNSVPTTVSVLLNGSALPFAPQFAYSPSTVSGTYFITSTGSSTIAISATCTYTSGTTTLNGSLVIQTV